MAQLTERQQQVKALMDEGKKPKEIGETLGISENAVYQHRRRIQQGDGQTAAPGKRRGRPPKAAPKPPTLVAADDKEWQVRATSIEGGGSGTYVAPTPPPPIDPLDAVRDRRGQIQHVLDAAKYRADDTAATAAEAAQAYADAQAEWQPELYRLDTAEQVLTGQLKPAAPAPVGRSRKATPERAEAEAQQAAAEAPDEPSGNGAGEVETVPQDAVA